MLPTMGQIHTSTLLSNISIGYSNSMFVADRLFPHVTVAKQSDKYAIFLKGAWFRNEARPRDPGAEAPRSGYHVSSGTYSCIEYAGAKEIPIEHINNADAPIRPWESGVRFATNQVMLAKEVLARDAVFAGSVFTNEEDAEGGWAGTTDGSGNTFIADVLKAKEAIRKLIGVYPNVMLMDAGTFNEIKQEYTVLERIKYTGTSGKPADVTLQTLAQLFELDEILLGGAIKSDAEEVMAGTDFNSVSLWEANANKGSALLYYRTPTPALWEPSTGYTFSWPGGKGHASSKLASSGYRQVRYWWEDSPKQWVIEASECFDIKVTSADSGYLFTDTIAT